MTDDAGKRQPWPGDILDRSKVADNLTAYLVKRFRAKPKEPGFVLAIDADWGLGKTFLLTNWISDLEQDGYPAVYFDAWKNDFTPEPLIAFLAEIDKSLRPIAKTVPVAIRTLDAVIEKGQSVVKPLASIALQIATKKLLGLSVDQIQNLLDNDDVDSVFDDDSDDVESASNDKPVAADDPKKQEIIAKALKKIHAVALKDHANKAKSITGFKKNLLLLIGQLGMSTNVDLPIFFIVDELDRCRPDYAIELLEGIKHLFGVPGVYFVIATNMEQLAHSTKAIYGSDFDGHRYLKRFFDLEFRLPEPDHKRFADLLFSEAVLPADLCFFTGLDNHNYPNNAFDRVSIFAFYARAFSLTLRDQQQVMKVIEAACSKLTQVHPHWLFFLAMLQSRHPGVFSEIVNSGGSLANARFQTILEQLGLGKLSFLTVSYPLSVGEAAHRRTETTTSVLQLAWGYYRFSFMTAQDARKAIGDNRDDFPNLLYVHAMEAPNSVQHPANEPGIAGYPDLIRYAGQFS